MRRIAGCGVLAMLAAGCGGGPALPLTSEGSLASLAVIDTTAEHQPLEAEVFTPADDGEPLDVGDTVRTDDTGFAEIAYADGSLTRLGADTVVTVLALDGDVTVPQVELDLDVGRVWNRVNTVTGERGRFEIRTDVGTAAVRGTAFAVECTREAVCTFTVSEGSVEVVTPDGRVVEVVAGELVTLARDDDDAGATEGGADGDDDGATGGDGAAGGNGEFAAATVELERTDIPEDGEGGTAAWLDRNAALDRAPARFAPAQQRCSVAVAGRNLDHASTPATAIEVPIDEQLRVDAVAVGPVERYTVDLALGGLSMRAARGEVLPDDTGDRSTFRGTVDVSAYAAWGVGLYEVTAATTGTVCHASAFVHVTGRHPLTTGTGLLSLVLVLGGAVGLLASMRRAAASGDGATATDPAANDGSQQVPSPTAWTSRITRWFRRGR